MASLSSNIPVSVFKLTMPGMATNGQERKGAKEVEKIQPVAERRSWRDYSAWIGIAAVAAVSLAMSLYLYLAKP
jgi:hypothetical protein